MKSELSNQRGIAHALVLFLIIAVGIVSFILILNLAPATKQPLSLLNPKPQSDTAAVQTASPTIGSCLVLPTDNVWNTPIDNLPIDPNSTNFVTKIGLSKPLHPDFGSGTNGIPFDLVTGTQAKTAVSFTYADESDPGPYPIPVNPSIEGGYGSSGDRHVLLVDQTNCVLYELYDVFPQTPAGWSAGSGAIFNLNSNALRPSGWTSADAAGLPIFPGLVRYDEILAGSINHAIRFTTPQTQAAFIWPARHLASSISDKTYPPMGIRVRLKLSFDISSFSPTNQIILKALKKYGMILADNGSSWFISGAPDNRWDDNDLHQLTTILGSNFEVVDESSLQIDPNSGQAKQANLPSPTPILDPTPPPHPTPSPSAALIPGDLDGDGKVGIFDYNILLGNFGKTGSGIPGDIDADGMVGIFDYNILVGNFGK